MKTQKFLSLFQQQKKGLTQYRNPGCQRWHKKLLLHALATSLH